MPLWFVLGFQSSANRTVPTVGDAADPEGTGDGLAELPQAPSRAPVTAKVSGR
jgi:hypothetical protein